MNGSALASDAVVGVAVALGAGLLVGLERERRKGRGPAREPAGIRTFTIAALGGALAQVADGGTRPGWLVLLGALAVVSLVAIAYARGRSRDPGMTTELALVVTYALGVLAVSQPALAAAAAVVLTVVLAARTRLHRFATQLLTEAELHDALLLAALALVVLPLLPDAPLPWLAGLRPHTLAALMLLILLLQAAGHVALRWLGARRGLLVAGFASGFVSSTATVASMGALARRTPAAQRLAMGGAVMSNAATWTQALVMLTAVSPPAAAAFWPAAVAGAAVSVGGALALSRAPADATPATPAAGRGPLRVREAATVALLLAGVTLLVSAAQARFGDAGVLAGSALSGLVDAQSGIVALGGLVGQGRIDVGTATLAVLAAIGTNTIVRSVVAFASGGARYAAAVGGTLALSWLAAAAARVLAAG